MPAEWEPHEATWLAWPHNEDHWPEKYDPVPETYVKIIEALAPSEKVYITVNDQAMEDKARYAMRHLSASVLKQVTFFHIPTDASWARDHGPIFVKDPQGNLTALDFVFNAWGKKYEPYDRDDIVPVHVAKVLGLPVIQSSMVLEGGSIDVNGAGSLLTTEQCLLNKNRNPDLSKKEIEENLRKFLGITQVLWLNEGIVGDDTDGHVDDIARFVDANTIVTVVESNPEDENYAILQENLDRLRQMNNPQGVPFKIVELPMPSPVFFKEQRLPASYANFYIGNNTVLVPTFRCKNDKAAIDILQSLFPNRKVVGIDCTDLVWGLGTIHCSTQQQPK
jgi:agmatine deiminase